MDEGSRAPLAQFADYLQGVIHQGTGDLDAALSVFQSPSFALPAAKSTDGVQRDLSILAQLNAILVLREPSSSTKHQTLERLFAAVEGDCVAHPNRNIQSAFNLVKATSHPSDAGIKRKNNVQAALNAAGSVANMQLKCMTLNFMSWTYFRGVVGEQAEKASRAALKLARDSSNVVWASAAAGMLADTLEVQGKMSEASSARADAVKLAERVVPGVMGSRARARGVAE